MTQQVYGQTFRGNPAENYHRYFVPAIGAPMAKDLMEAARLQPGERVLDVGCGTGVVTRSAAERVGLAGNVAGLDVAQGMLAVARSQTPPGISIDWYEATAESMPLADQAFDVVLCQMALQFIPNKLVALREMRRIERQQLRKGVVDGNVGFKRSVRHHMRSSRVRLLCSAQCRDRKRAGSEL